MIRTTKTTGTPAVLEVPVVFWWAAKAPSLGYGSPRAWSMLHAPAPRLAMYRNTKL
jgi:hypothetical protein